MKEDFFHLKDKVCLITGASSGLGKQTCKILDSIGAKVIAIARREENLKQLQKECKNLEYKIYDFYFQSGIKNLIDDIVKEYGKINAMAYFSGISCVKPLRMVDLEEAKKVFDVNFFSCLELLKCLYDKRKSENLSAVLISSASLKMSISSMSVYDASKGALDTLSVSLVKDFAKFGFRINSILPAHIDTEMTHKVSSIRSDNYNLELEKLYPLGVGKDEDIANLCVFLLSPLSAWMSGQSIVMDGGRALY
ncbi:SDR family NAD(P)-dependent oxidoreductase [Campylobacter molothri]|uniref:SDR family NAD(P)-dependent oxidoreductase n=1 Tax=Campylobacter molothri TaxID=1032242 RepID=UPI001D1FB7C6|nr:SDR family oxidoreductase [Campylobacter sp. W0065]MBZ7959085.1 SDR family oxidoreductase [Campylobacter sp. RM12397]MBZ7965863.1 SDR family oxidoreductase [Campylobacter sp. RM10535]